MSSDASEAVVQTGRLVIHIAENGHSYELECDEYTLVESVQKFLESLSGISYNDQLLLCVDMKLEPNRPLSSYKLPSENREIFLFNKSRMRRNSPPPSPEQLEILDITNTPLPSSPHKPHPLDDSPDPALKALPSYERQFRHHFQHGHMIFNRTLAKSDKCDSLFQEMKVQERALEIAGGNLDHFYKMILQNYNDFIKCYSMQHRSHSSLLVNFGRDLEKLRSVKLLPELQTGNSKCLLDFVKEENLRKMVEDCGNSHRQFENKVSEFKHEFGDLKRNTENLFSGKVSSLIKDLDLAMKEHQRFINEQKSIMQALSKDVNTVKKLIEDCLSCQLSSSLRPHDAVSALGPIYDSHEKNYLPKMEECDRAISNLLNFFADKKNEMNLFVHNYMQKIAYIQYTIKDVRFKFSVFQEALKRQNDQFEHLKVVRGIGPAYKACLAEIVRRKWGMKIYMGRAGQLAEKLARERDDEITRRDEFLKKISNFIPRDILSSMGLYDNPTPCDVNVTPFDSNLLNIDLLDIDRFASELLAKSEGHGSEDFPLDFEEISGTSKLEVENAKLKAELASKIALMCSMSVDLDYESLDEGQMGNLLKNAEEKTSEALRMKEEYEKHLESMLREKKMQCLSYEKRIQELEQKLSDHYTLSTEDVSIGSSSLKSRILPGSEKGQEGLDDNMTDSSSNVSNPQLDSSMRDYKVDKGIFSDKEKKETASIEPSLDDKESDALLMELRNSLANKSSQLENAEMKVQELMEEVSKLGRELEVNQKLLDEYQMNCAHLENCLHEAREEAQTHQCAADRRESEYSALRISVVKMRGIFERLKTSILSNSFADSLSALAQSLDSESEDNSTPEFHDCLLALSDKVGALSRHHADLLDRYSKSESANDELKKELEEKKESINTLYVKHQMEKQAIKEKISFGRLEVQEIAAFIQNPAGYYEAINRNSPHYYLSNESVALYVENLPNPPSYIVGQVVHIERKTVKSPPSISDEADSLKDGGNLGSNLNPYGLQVGCEYYIVTVAMLPDAIRSHPSS